MAVQEGAGPWTGVFCVLGLIPILGCPAIPGVRRAVLLGASGPGPYTPRTI